MTLPPTSKPAAQNKKVLIETWGCQMNVADSETILANLLQANYSLTDSAEDADLVLLNTCHIRDKAKHKVLSRLGRLKEVKERNPKLKIAVAGCVAQAEGKRLFKESPQIDLLIGPGKIHRLRDLLDDMHSSGKSVSALGFKEDGADKSEPKIKPTLTGKNEISRYVNITQGCDNFCTFCVVPFTRGREISRSPQLILDECKRLLDAGAKEITLLGQNVNSYGSDIDSTFVDLLKLVLELKPLKRLRFTTSNPHDFTKPLAELFQHHQKLGSYMHLPVQSGNDTLLKRMRRKVTVDEYLERIEWLRSFDQDFAISSDIIVGFPGESDSQFEDTLKLVESIRYSFLFSFKYSPRKNTAAYRFPDQIPEALKSERLERLNQLQNMISIEQMQSEIGLSREVLFTYESKKEPGIYYGRTPQFRLTRVKSAANIIGETRVVEIIDGNKTALVGNLAD